MRPRLLSRNQGTMIGNGSGEAEARLVSAIGVNA